MAEATATDGERDAPGEPAEIEVELTAMAHGGSALGRHNKQTVFIPYTLPGERVLARLTLDKGRIAFAEGVRLLTASADRAFPRCQHFGPGRCGVCQWQHIAPNVQPLIKQDVLADQLARVGGFDDAAIESVMRPIIPSPQAWGYAHHLDFVVTESGELGLPLAPVPGDAPGTGAIVIEECHILHPDLLDLYHQLDLEAISRLDGLAGLRLQIGSDGERMVVLRVDDENQAPELELDIPGVSANLLLPGDEPVNLIGETHSRYTINGRTLRVTAGDSFRANIAALGGLVDAVLDALALDDSGRALELYAGVGLFSAFIAPRVAHLTLIEHHPPSATDADDNLAEFEHLDLLEGALDDVLPELEGDFERVLLDPPPDGLSLAVMDWLAARAIPRLVYVSSDPATLARDAKRLVAHGYALTSVQPLDLAPQTYAITSVAAFTRGSRN